MESKYYVLMISRVKKLDKIGGFRNIYAPNSDEKRKKL